MRDPGVVATKAVERNSVLTLKKVDSVHSAHIIKEYRTQNQIASGIYSEEEIELVHFDFKDLRKKYKIHLSLSEYQNHLPRYVCEFNDLHV